MTFQLALVNPPPRNEADRHWARFPLLGLAYVASSAKKDGHGIHLLDGKLSGLSCEDIVNRMLEIQPNLIGITCMTVEFPAVVSIAAMVKSKLAIPIVVGGAHINAVGIDALKECPDLDFACVGEGEHLVNELIDALKNRKGFYHIPGLAYRFHGHVFLNRSRAYPDDYDQLPFPEWGLFESVNQIPVLTHRGCPFKCTFCGHNSGFKPRYRSTDSVLDEIERDINEFKPNVIRFEDETFGLNMNRTKRILHGIIERGFNKHVVFSAQTRVDRIDGEFIRLLGEANFEMLELGVETGNEQILKEIKKGITLSQVRYAVSVAKMSRLKVWCKFILGHPGETTKTMGDTLNLICELNPDRLSVSIMTPYPGTPIYDMAVRGEGGYRLLASDWGSFDKYSKGVLELENVSLSKLKAYQIMCYLALYVRNYRLYELIQLTWSNRAMVKEMLGDLIVSITSIKYRRNSFLLR